MDYLKYPGEGERARKALAVLLWLLTALCMAGIFLFSHQSGDESKALSEDVRGLLFRLLGGLLDSFIVRKFAHFFEFLILAFLLSGALLASRRRFLPLAAFIISLAYSVSDEIHQYFIPERACRLFDIFVDSCGAALGIALFAALLAAVNLCRSRLGEQKERPPLKQRRP